MTSKVSMTDTYFNFDREYSNKFGDRTVVLFQCGSFYEMYAKEEDYLTGKFATVTKLLGWSVTEPNMVNKSGKKQRSTAQAGCPLVSYDKFKRLLLDNRYTVVRVDQKSMGVSNPERYVAEVVSPGLDVESTNDDNTFFMSVYIEGIAPRIGVDPSTMMARYGYGSGPRSSAVRLHIGVSVIDVRTSENYVHEIEPSVDNHFSKNELFRLVRMYAPVQILFHTTNCTDLSLDKLHKLLELGATKTHHNVYMDTPLLRQVKHQNYLLGKAFPKVGLETVFQHLNLDTKYFARKSYVCLLQFCAQHNEIMIEKLTPPRVNVSSQHLVLSSDSLSQLNILPQHADPSLSHLFSTGQEHRRTSSVWNLVNHTCTPPGRRCLKHALVRPIICSKELRRRYSYCKYLLENDRFESYSHILKNVYDIERFHRQMNVGTLLPRTFATLDLSYAAVEKVMALIRSHDTMLATLLPSPESVRLFEEFVHDYRTKINVRAIRTVTRSSIMENFFHKGVYPEIDAVQQKIDREQSFLHSVATFICEKLKIDFKEFRSDKNGTYFFSLTPKRMKSLTTILKQHGMDTPLEFYTGSGNQRCVKTILPSTIQFKKAASSCKLRCPEIDSVSNSLHFLHSKITRLTLDAFDALLVQYSLAYSNALQDVTHFVAQLDFFQSNAHAARAYQLYQPTVSKLSVNGSFVEASNLRHPLIERINTEEEYIANDVSLGPGQNQLGMLLYGVNAVGKSSYMKSVGVAVIMAQAGMFVPASDFTFVPYHHIFTRISNNDNIHKSQSTFMVECSELKTIERLANSRSLVLGDELCSGTETDSAEAIVATTILLLMEAQTSFVFTSHLHNLVTDPDINQLDLVNFYHMETRFDDDQQCLVYNRKIKPGPGEKVYGLEVAKACGLSEKFIRRAMASRKKKQQRENPATMVPLSRIPHTSRYNANVLMGRCAICSHQSVETHHIKPQCDADEHGVIGHHHKNIEHNVVSLCKECHAKTTYGNLDIRGWVRTSKGLQLDYSMRSPTAVGTALQNRKKYSLEQVALVKTFRPKPGEKSNLSYAKKQLQLHHNLRISQSVIKKMWNDVY